MATKTAARSLTQFHIGTPGQKWGPTERAAWLKEQKIRRDYFLEVVSPLSRFTRGEVFQYGELNYLDHGAAKYPLFAVRSSNWDRTKPLAIVTGGVHGYETSGVHGTLRFLSSDDGFSAFTAQVNLLVLPCISPWGYETINRWTPNAVDPNRCFLSKPREVGSSDPFCSEAAQAMACIIKHAIDSEGVLLHCDLHETTDTDNDIFTPAKAARDGAPLPEWWPIPDGFYLIGDEPRPQLDWHRAMIDAVRAVTHIAQPDENGAIAGETTVKSDGVLICPSVGDCASFTAAKYCTTTEVYPDSLKTNPDECNRAQAAAVVAGLKFALAAQVQVA